MLKVSWVYIRVVLGPYYVYLGNMRVILGLDWGCIAGRKTKRVLEFSSVRFGI